MANINGSVDSPRDGEIRDHYRETPRSTRSRTRSAPASSRDLQDPREAAIKDGGDACDVTHLIRRRRHHRIRQAHAGAGFGAVNRRDRGNAEAGESRTAWEGVRGGFEVAARMPFRVAVAERASPARSSRLLGRRRHPGGLPRLIGPKRDQDA